MAVKPKDDPVAGLLRQTLAKQTANAGCPDAETLAAYYDRALDPVLAARCQAHFAECARCREQLALLARSDESRELTREHHWVWDWRWLAATGALLAVVTYWGLQRSTHLATTTTPVVAMTQPQSAPRQAAPGPAPTVAVPPAAKAQDLAPRAEAPAESLAPPVSNSLSERKAPRNPPPNGSNYSNLKRVTPLANEPSRAASSADSAAAHERETEQKAARGRDAAASASQPQAAISAESAPQTAAVAAAPEPRANGDLAAPAPVQSRENAASQSAPAGTYGALRGDKLQKATVSGAFILVKTPEARTIWRITNGLHVEISHDAGASWQAEKIPAAGEILAGAAPTAKVLWLAGRGGTILLTTDGGATWQTGTPPAKADFVAISAVSTTDATVTMPDGRRLVTADGGHTWTPVL